jgi:1,4-dihydroxy-2-naphthoate octaprenyltransferase
MYLSIVLERSTIQLLRFHFSLFLFPVFLFALSQVPTVDWLDAILAFIILHLLVYPSSNGYNSYMDRDSSPIGGLSNPLQPTRQLFYLTIILDAVALGLSFFISQYFALGVLIYILASRAYSYRGIRLKKYAVIGYLVVLVCQGALVFFLSYHACSSVKELNVPIPALLSASFLIGGSYPLTQIYQHKEDEADGVQTISMLLGKKGTFIFCSFVFTLATFFLFLLYKQSSTLWAFWLFILCMGPMAWYFVRWMRKVWIDGEQANFRNSLRMNILATICTTVCFSILIIKNHF